MRDGQTSRAPLANEIEEMMNYVGQPSSAIGVRPVTAHVVIVPVRARIIPLRIRVKPFTQATKQSVAEAWAAFIATLGDDNDAFNNSPIGAKIERSRIIEALFAAADEYAHDLLESSDKIILEPTEYAVTGSIIFEEPN